MMCNDDFLQKDPDEAIEYLDDLAEKAHTWTEPSPTDSTNRSRPPGNPTSTGIYQLREEDSLKAKVEALTKEFETLRAKGSKPAQTVSRVESLGPCFVCGWRNHPNLSWKSENQQTTQSNRTYSAPSYQPTPSRNSLEDTLHAFIEAQGKTNQKFETMINQVVEENKEIKNHVSKLTNALTVGERGKFPAQAQPNPKGQHMAQTSGSGESNLKEANAITTRSWKVIEPISKPRESEKESSESDESSPSDEAVGNPSRVPFPQALKLSPKSVNQHSEILEHLRQVKINLPLLHVISQVPTYAKVLKDLCTVKRKHIVKKTAFLIEQVSAVIEQRIPPKYKDPGCLTVSCVIGNHEFAQALLDLGTSVNLMPHSIYLLLGLGEIKPTSVVLQLADRSTIRPRGVVEDVLVQIDKFYYPVDFLVLDVKVDVNVDSKIPIILGRPFLATANALINCRNGLMKLSFGNMTLEVKIFHIAKQPMESDECHHTHMIEALTQEEALETTNSDPLNLFLLNSANPASVNDEEYANLCAIFAKFQNYGISPWQPKFEELPKRTGGQQPLSIESPKPDLKPLPPGLKHEFLGPGDTFPVIISSELDALQCEQLLNILNEHKSALGWTIADIKGISPLICSHRIHIEEGATPKRDPQHRLNPTMKEVVKNEVLKLLDAGIIYPIADSKWVSPTQVVPKKSGVTVVKNEVGEMVPTKTVTGCLADRARMEYGNPIRSDNTTPWSCPPNRYLRDV
ncbi:uncharacterized protein LOC111411218 [Olea europaea var. sylvestris]|uniref:uncharacterized protein LOC111411218 n=1 Tax=Olea europaea var. sylvestris TaxID=158386 RepID=UPI000C1D85CF|nr:uncharacterized protein LOC111411218 [Olea europaea var. sylvestris]